jgi:hypothetical protein
MDRDHRGHTPYFGVGHGFPQPLVVEDDRRSCVCFRPDDRFRQIPPLARPWRHVPHGLRCGLPRPREARSARVAQTAYSRKHAHAAFDPVVDRQPESRAPCLQTPRRRLTTDDG